MKWEASSFFLFLFVLVLIIGIASAGWGQGQEEDCPFSRDWPSNQGFGISLATDKAVYHPGDAISITLTVFNCTHSSLTFSFSDAQRYDFVIKKDGEIIWRWSEGKMFAQVIGKEEIDSGETVSYKETYVPEEKLPSGIYSVTGTLTSRQAPLQATVYIEVGERR